MKKVKLGSKTFYVTEVRMRAWIGHPGRFFIDFKINIMIQANEYMFYILAKTISIHHH